MLLDYYIDLMRNREALKGMITESKITIQEESKTYDNVVNKAQRYACLRRYVKLFSMKDAQPMIDAEMKRDYSASDEIELIRLRACNPDQAAKQELWNKYVSDTAAYKQQDFIASTAFFFNKGDHSQCRFFVNLWFESLEKTSDKHYDYFKMYFLQLAPSFMGEEQDAKRMRELLAKYENTDKSYLCRCLKEEIYSIENVRKFKQYYTNK